MDHTLEGLKWLNAARFQSLYEVAGGFGCRIGPNLFGCYLPAPSYRAHICAEARRLKKAAGFCFIVRKTENHRPWDWRMVRAAGMRTTRCSGCLPSSSCSSSSLAVRPIRLAFWVTAVRGGLVISVHS